MSRRYDSSTTTFSPEGRLHQVEYAIEAINNAGTCVGILAEDGVVLASEKKITSKLLTAGKVGTSEKTYKISSQIATAVAGLSADANILIGEARLKAGRYNYMYEEQIPVEQLVEDVCNYKQAYTQHGGYRPFGVAFLFAGYDSLHGFQLYQSDPSGNYSGWRATCIGANNQSGKSLLKNEYQKDDNTDAKPSLDEALKLAVKVLNKTMDTTTASADKMEFFTMKLDKATGLCIHHVLSPEEAAAVVKSVEEETAAAGDS